MDRKLEFSVPTNVYSEAIHRKEPSLVFEVRNGLGCFLFMMFFDDERAYLKINRNFD